VLNNLEELLKLGVVLAIWGAVGGTPVVLFCDELPFSASVFLAFILLVAFFNPAVTFVILITFFVFALIGHLIHIIFHAHVLFPVVFTVTGNELTVYVSPLGVASMMVFTFIVAFSHLTPLEWSFSALERRHTNFDALFIV